MRTDHPTVAESWPAHPAAVPATRRFVRQHLVELGVPALVGDAELVVTELVTNVVLHVGGTVAVAARVDEQGLLLEVTDTSAAPPVVREFSATSGTGRGLRLVHSLCVDHGVVPVQGGKTVWARLGRGDAGAA